MVSGSLKNGEVQIYYEAWQMDCCGTPFALGDDVDWYCHVRSDHERKFFPDILYAYEAHGEIDCTVLGQVVAIDAVHYAIDPDTRVPMAYRLSPISECAAFLKADGYLITLKNVQIIDEKPPA